MTEIQDLEDVQKRCPPKEDQHKKKKNLKLLTLNFKKLWSGNHIEESAYDRILIRTVNIGFYYIKMEKNCPTLEIQLQISKKFGKILPVIGF